MQSCLAVSGLQQKYSRRFSSCCVVLYKHCSENTETEWNSVKQLSVHKQKLTRVELWVDQPVRTERIAASTHSFHSAGKGATCVNCTTICTTKKNAYSHWYTKEFMLGCGHDNICIMQNFPVHGLFNISTINYIALEMLLQVSKFFCKRAEWGTDASSTLLAHHMR